MIEADIEHVRGDGKIGLTLDILLSALNQRIKPAQRVAINNRYRRSIPIRKCPIGIGYVAPFTLPIRSTRSSRSPKFPDQARAARLTAWSGLYTTWSRSLSDQDGHTTTCNLSTTSTPTTIHRPSRPNTISTWPTRTTDPFSTFHSRPLLDLEYRGRVRTLQYKTFKSFWWHSVDLGSSRG